MTYHPILHRTCPNDRLRLPESRHCQCCCTGCQFDCSKHHEQHSDCLGPARFWMTRGYELKWWQLFHFGWDGAKGGDEWCNSILGIKITRKRMLMINLNVPMRRWSCDECVNTLLG